jgi:chromosome segregation ATPase
VANSNTWLAPIVVALIAALGTYLGLVRRTSGKITTTEAGKLWEEATTLRGVYRDEIARLREEIEELEGEARACQTVIDEQRDQLRQIKIKNDDLERRNARIQRELDNHASV